MSAALELAQLASEIFVDSTGNIGIGTTSPLSVLHVNHVGNNTTALIIGDDVTIANNTGIYLRSNGIANIQWGTTGTLTLNAGASERLRIDSAGNVGIGTTNTIAALSVARGASLNAYIEVAGNGNTIGTTSMLYGQDATGNIGYCWNRANGPVIFGTNNAERIRLDASGNVGIGTASPSSQLEISSSVRTRLFLTGTATSSGGPTNGYWSQAKNLGGTAVVNGQALNYIGAGGWDGTAYREAGYVFIGTDGTPANSTVPGYISFWTTPAGTSQVALERMRIDSSGNANVVNSSGSLGYGTGAGGTVTQATSKSTAVAINKPTGRITMNASALAAGASTSFAVNNSIVATTDTVILALSGGTTDTNLYRIEMRGVGAGSFVVRVTNLSASSLSEALLINFAVISGATA